MSEQGARDFIKGVLWTTLQNFSFMLPVILVYLFLQHFLSPYLYGKEVVTTSIWEYIVFSIMAIGIIYVITRFQYENTYVNVYNESAVRRISLAEKLRKLPLSYFGEKNLSDLTSTVMQDATDLEHTFSHAVPQLVGSFVTLILAMIGLGFMNWQLALAVFWVVPVALTVLWITKKMQMREHQTSYLQKRAVTEKIQEGIQQIQEIKSYGQEEIYLHELSNEQERFEKGQIKGELLIGVIINTVHALIKLGIPTLILVGTTLLLAGKVNFLTYLFFLILSSVIFNPLLNALEHGAVLFFLDIRINRMNEIMNLPVQTGTAGYYVDDYTIRFDHVGFSYKDDEEKVLHDVSFEARQGEVTALIGPSGGGKSTAAKLAARFWDVNSGTITLGGTDITTIDPEALLKNYSIVFQDVVLFNGSVMDNIRIGKKDASDGEVLCAAHAAQCDDFVHNLPDGYRTIIGENGSTLSGGERQRISIARALLKDAPIVLLDEATASVDAENETKIQAAISELVKNRTVLIIAHRMRTVANADKIVVLENGRVAEIGSPSALIKQNGLFARMLRMQSTDVPRERDISV
ncbi:ABC-type multidrug transport system [Proteiniphilum saccharofermentans]|uniref:ABC-type multidrug transport system n=2 Tax=Proteiniphilum saccharofermentans TaxID=1642647 RepID=A0A1R3TB22_9BACT|nr:ABC-type multidrug transport system [Proteiniphilum saccharofermentans]